jgi:predicted outer membrane repeat protein
MRDCASKQNQAGTRGGAFYVLRGLTYFSRSLFEGNETGGDGGGGYNLFGNVIVTNCTFYDNQARNGGGLYCADTSTANITNSTFSANVASVPDGGGGLYANFNTHVHNSIIAQSGSGGNCGNASSKPTNFYNNIEDGTSCGWSSYNGSKSNTNPLLGPLKDNGGGDQNHGPAGEQPGH